MPNRIELQSALTLREPAVVVCADGTEWEFPPDLPSQRVAEFLLAHGAEFGSGELSIEGTMAFFRFVFADQYDEFMQAATWAEAREAAWALYFHYMGVRKPGGAEEAGGDDDNPPAQA